MKHKVSELSGALLDEAVAMAEGLPLELVGQGMFAPSSDWLRGGPIIEREGIEITVSPHGDGSWLACRGTWPQKEATTWGYFHGPNPRVAAMRAYVASKFGDVVELP